MATLVHKAMEDMVPELHDYEERGIFSKMELKKIVSSREAFEYKMQRREKNMIDFQRYIEYELNINALLQKRKRRLDIEKTSKHDFAPIRRVSAIYERALRRFPQNLPLWYQYIGHLEHFKRYNSLRHVFPRALQMHPREPLLWARAAASEFSNNNDVSAARVLLQRGLRFNKESEILWVSLFTMEVRYIQKLVVRRRTLGIDTKDKESKDADAKMTEFLSGALPMAIHKNCMAIESLSSRLSVHESFLNAIPPPPALQTKFRDNFGPLRDIVIESIREKIGTLHAEAWGLLAQQAQRQGKIDALVKGAKQKAARRAGILRAIAVFEEGVIELPKGATWSIYAKFLYKIATERNDTNIAKKIVKVCERAKLEESLELETYLLWTDVLIRMGIVKRALETAIETTKAFSKSSKAWILLADIKSKYEQKTSFEKRYSELVSTLKEAVKVVPAKDSLILWIRLLSSISAYSTISGHEKDGIADLRRSYTKALRMFKGADRHRLQMLFLSFNVTNSGGALHVVKKTVMLILEGKKAGEPGIPLWLVIQCLEALAGASPSPEKLDIKKMVTMALEEYGDKKANIWLWYVRWSLTVGESAAEINRIFWRANKALEKSPEEKKQFLKAHQKWTSKR